MTRSRIFVLAAALFSLPALDVIVPQVAQAQNAGQWEMLGAHTVNGRNDVDTFNVGAHKGDYTAIRIRVENASCVITRLEIHFADGGAPHISTGRIQVAANSTSREIDLPGRARDIRKVVMKYSDIPDGRVPRVEVWGKDVSTAAVKLGEHAVNGSRDIDTFDVDGRGGMFDAIAIRADGDNVRIHHVVVRLTNGQMLNLPDDFTLQRNERRFMDLPGERRAVKSVTFNYSNIGPTQNARLELWGHR